MAIEDPITQSMPAEWSSEHKKIAKDSMLMLLKHYPGWLWAIEFQDDPKTGAIAALVLRIRDLPAKEIYIIHAKDLDYPELKCIMRAGGEFLEAFGLPRGKNQHEKIHDLARTPSGLLVPHSAAIPTNNPGYMDVKAREDRESVATAVQQYVDSLTPHERSRLKNEYDAQQLGPVPGTV